MANNQPSRSNFVFHQQWDHILSFFLDSRKLLPEKCFEFESEFNTTNLILSSEDTRTILNLWLNAIPEISHQSLKTSTSYLEQADSVIANKSKMRENSYTAVNFYTKALYAAPKPDIAAVCHAQRAVALIQLGFFEEAYDDGTCAIELGISSLNLATIYKQLAACAAALQDTQKLLQSVEVLKQTATKFNSSTEEIEQLRKLIKEIAAKEKPAKEIKLAEKKQIIYRLPFVGKFVVSAEPIKENETLLTEKAFAFVPIYGQFQQVIDCNCQNCGQENIVPFPCYVCTKICYCSPKCKAQHKQIHLIECKGLQKNLFFEIGVGHLAFRTLLAGIDSLINYILKTTKNVQLNANEMWLKVVEFSQKDKSQYASIMKLVTNYNKMDIMDYLRYALTGSMLACYLSTLTNFFQINIPKKCYDIMKSENDWLIIIAAILTRHIGQMICNAHTIPGLLLSMDKSTNIYKSKNELIAGKLHYYSQSAQIFAAIYPRVSIYNHSCEPNIRFRFSKTNLTVIANRNIATGIEIRNCYSRNYKTKSRAVRLNELSSQYFFDCTCKHCVHPKDTEYKRMNSVRCNRLNCNFEFYPENQPDNWWLIVDLTSNVKIICPKCTNPLNFQWFEEFEIITNNYNNNTDKKNEQLYRMCELFEYAKKTLIRSHGIKMSMCYFGIKTALASLQGCQKVDKKLYGKFIEMAIEWLNCNEALYGLYDLEYVSSTTMILDLLILLKEHGAKMEFKYDLTKIKNSFQVLSEQTKIIFDIYFDQYVQEFI